MPVNAAVRLLGAGWRKVGSIREIGIPRRGIPKWPRAVDYFYSEQTRKI